MEIKEASAADIPQLCGLLEALFAQEAEFTPERAAQERGVRMVLETPELGAVLTACEGDRVVAMVTLLYTVSTALGERVALLEDMVVSPAERGKGVGSALLTYAVAYAREKGCRRVTLLSDGDNESAHRFYARHGFRRSAMVPFRMETAGGGTP